MNLKVPESAKNIYGRGDLCVDYDTDYVINEITRLLAVKGVGGRFSTWPVASSRLLTAASTDYAIKWINGEVPKEGVDMDVLKQLMEDYAGVEVFLTPYINEYPYTEDGAGETYDNFLLMRMDYITF